MLGFKRYKLRINVIIGIIHNDDEVYGNDDNNKH